MVFVSCHSQHYNSIKNWINTSFFPVKCFLYLKWNCLLWSPSLEICLFQSKVFELCNFFPIPLNYIIVMFNVTIGYKKKTRISFFSIFLNWIENTQSKQIKKWDLLWRYRCSLHKYTNKKKKPDKMFFIYCAQIWCLVFVGLFLLLSIYKYAMLLAEQALIHQKNWCDCLNVSM